MQMGSLIFLSAPNPFSRTMVQRFSQSVAEISNERYLAVKCGRRVRLTT
jgi:hypothetical protein